MTGSNAETTKRQQVGTSEPQTIPLPTFIFTSTLLLSLLPGRLCRSLIFRQCLSIDKLCHVLNDARYHHGPRRRERELLPASSTNAGTAATERCYAKLDNMKYALSYVHGMANLSPRKYVRVDRCVANKKPINTEHAGRGVQTTIARIPILNEI